MSKCISTRRRELNSATGLPDDPVPFLNYNAALTVLEHEIGKELLMNLSPANEALFTMWRKWKEIILHGEQRPARTHRKCMV